MITKESIEAIEKSAIVFDTISIERRGEVFDLFVYYFIEKSHIFTGNAEVVAKYLNDYFDLHTSASVESSE